MNDYELQMQQYMEQRARHLAMIIRQKEQAKRIRDIQFTPHDPLRELVEQFVKETGDPSMNRQQHRMVPEGFNYHPQADSTYVIPLADFPEDRDLSEGPYRPPFPGYEVVHKIEFRKDPKQEKELKKLKKQMKEKEKELAQAEKQTEELKKTANEAKVTTTECVICMDMPANTAMVPCGHLVTCFNCAETLKEKRPLCPICRQEVVMTCKIFATTESTSAVSRPLRRASAATSCDTGKLD